MENEDTRNRPDENTPIGTVLTVTRGGCLEDLDVVLVEHVVAHDGRKYAKVYDEYNEDEDDIEYDGLELTEGMDTVVAEKYADTLLTKTMALQSAVTTLRAQGDHASADDIEQYFLNPLTA